MDETEKLIDFLDKKIDGIGDRLGGDLKHISDRVESYLAQPEKCALKFEERFITRTIFKTAMGIIFLGFTFLLLLDMNLHDVDVVMSAVPRAILGSAK